MGLWSAVAKLWREWRKAPIPPQARPERPNLTLPVAILKTSGMTLPLVVRHAKHALQVRPPFRRGDLVLLSQTRDSLPLGAPPIQWAFWFETYYADGDNESVALFGRRWRYIFTATRVERISPPFAIEDYQVTTTNYLQGGPMVYVDPADARALVERGALASLADSGAP